MMTIFIFAGDMLVMLFMVCLVIWVFMVESDSEIDRTARIPLRDEAPGTRAGSETGQQKQRKEGVRHG